MIKIIIADDEKILRNGLKTILEQDPVVHVCGLAANGNEAYNLCSKIVPDLILMDMKMPECGGDEATRKIKKSFPKVKILILTTFNDPQTVSAALSSGADGYILKDVDEERLVSAIKNTLSGMSVLGTEIFENIKVKFYQTNPLSKKLTDRDRELLSLVADGNSNKEIAEKMFLSDGTVRNNISILLEKLALKDRTQLAVYAVKHDLI
jgi:DNA-binding NarL/FixJ family response regulator